MKGRQSWQRGLLSIAMCTALLGSAQAVQAQSQVLWEPWQRLVGVVDVGGPRSDGRLVAMANGQMFLVAPDGTTAPFARGADGFSAGPDAESYLVVSGGQAVDGAGCSFAADDVYVLDLTSPPGIARVDASGRSSRLATIPQVDTLGGIALDTTGRFGNRLLVAGAGQGRQQVFAVDCLGRVSVVTDNAPPLEGGLVVAPATFGAFDGWLIGADENGGQVWAIAPDGQTRLVLTPDLPTGGDTGVESLGFVPPGFGPGSFVYLADRGTANNPFPGTDTLLRLSAATLAAQGVQAGDLLVSTEGGGRTVAIRCAADMCTAFRVADGPPDGNTGHIEGHIVAAVSR